MNNVFFKMIRRMFGENIMYECLLISKYYHCSLKGLNKVKPLAIFSMDSKDFTNGFADRLRGIISIYAYAKLHNIPFRINHKKPFLMETFFVPNKYDWLLKEGEISNNILRARPIVLRNHTKGNRIIHLNKKCQHHFYVNIDLLGLLNSKYNKDFNYKTLFNELFKPSQLLQERIAPYMHYVESGYISISFRFMQLMGDFQDCMGDILSEVERRELISNCHAFIHKLHHENSQIPYVLVTSDSSTFMKSINEIDFVFTLPGDIGHIGFSNDENTQVKTMMDFYMISKAQKAYMGYSGKMYKSHFAQSAAQTTGIEYNAIKF